MTSGTRARLLFAAVTAVVGAAVAVTIALLGSPGEQRKQRLDALRVEDLQGIQQSVLSFTKLRKRLPDNLDGLASEPGYAPPRTDPQSGAVYEYEKLNRDTFRVCATFETSSYGGRDSSEQPYTGTWSHHAGRECFEHRAEMVPEDVSSK